MKVKKEKANLSKENEGKEVKKEMKKAIMQERVKTEKENKKA